MVSLECYRLCRVFFFKQKTAYEMRISDWSSDVCSSDLRVLKQEFGFRTVADSDERSRFNYENFLDESLMLSGELNIIRVEWVVQYRIRSEERRVGKEWSVRVDLGGRRTIKTTQH